MWWHPCVVVMEQEHQQGINADHLNVWTFSQRLSLMDALPNMAK